ncbi:MAG: alpha/beta hydrolase [Rhodobacteraceae bacterium]|nr:alpha/beta hydrolase [Paracoccaceae bacterium]
MGKLAILWALVTAYLPEPVMKLVYLGRRETLGAHTLDAKAQAVGRFARATRPQVVPTVEESRKLTTKAVTLFDEPSPELFRKENIVIDGAEGPLNARIYSGPAKHRPRPILVYFHGGGWVQGDLDSHDGVCGKLAKWAGCIVISIDYRLAPEHKFPSAPLDAIAAYKWVRMNAASLGGDPERIGVGGDSAGGNLAAVVCQQTAINGERTPELQVLIYPALDGRMITDSMEELRDAYILPKDRMQYFLDLYTRGPDDILDIRLSPALRETVVDQPKACIVTGGFDPLRDDGDMYAERLTAEGIDVKHIQYPGQIHAFISLCKVVPQGNACIRDIADWLKTAWR